MEHIKPTLSFQEVILNLQSFHYFTCGTFLAFEKLCVGYHNVNLH